MTFLGIASMTSSRCVHHGVSDWVVSEALWHLAGSVSRQMVHPVPGIGITRLVTELPPGGQAGGEDRLAARRRRG
jgi:hypothetical protein